MTCRNCGGSTGFDVEGFEFTCMACLLLESAMSGQVIFFAEPTGFSPADEEIAELERIYLL